MMDEKQNKDTSKFVHQASIIMCSEWSVLNMLIIMYIHDMAHDTMSIIVIDIRQKNSHSVVCQSAGVINCVGLAHIIVFNGNNYIHTRQVDMFVTYVPPQKNEEDVPSEVWWLGRLCVLSMIALYSGVMHCGRVLGSVCIHIVHMYK